MNNRIARLEESFPDDADWKERLVALCVGLTGEPRGAFWKCVLACGRTRNIARRRAGEPPWPEPDSADLARAAGAVYDPDFERRWTAWLQRVADDHHGVPCDVPGCRYTST